jgi:hypothetical protein
MPASMTKSAWNRGAKNALICGGGVLALWLGLTGLVALIGGKSFAESRATGFVILWGLLFVWFFAAWYRGRTSGGPVLLDCGPHPTRSLFLLNAFTFLVIGMSVSRSLLNLGYFSPVFGLTFSLYWIVMATGRLQVREKGIWQYWSLLPWNKIQEYHWTDDGTLMLQTTGPLGIFTYGALPVPPERKEDFERLLSDKRGVHPAA